MTPKTRKIILVFTPPLLCLALLGGIVAQNASHLTPLDAQPFHQRAKQAILSFPYAVGYFTGSDVPVPTAAVKLLRPNVILSRLYVNNAPGASSEIVQRANLLIVQCLDSRDMLGHYPPVCYPANGMTLIRSHPRTWTIDQTTIRGMEYEFSQNASGESYAQVVYNFLIVPGHGIVRDMAGVNASAQDYQKRFFGAAQFQVVFDAELNESQRDGIFSALVSADLSVLETLERIE